MRLPRFPFAEFTLSEAEVLPQNDRKRRAQNDGREMAENDVPFVILSGSEGPHFA